MILRPQQIQQLALGLPTTPANKGGSSSSQANTTSQNTTSNVTQDRRLVVDNGGIGVTADNSSVSITSTDHGAIDAAAHLAEMVSNNQTASANHLVDAATQLNRTGYDMLKLNTDLTAHLNDSTGALVQQSLAQSQAALQVVSSVVSKPLDMNDPQHKLVAVGMAIVAIVAVLAFKGK